METLSPWFVRRFGLFRAQAAQVAVTTGLIVERVDVGVHRLDVLHGRPTLMPQSDSRHRLSARRSQRPTDPPTAAP